MKLRCVLLFTGFWLWANTAGGVSPAVQASSGVNLVVEEIQKAVPQAVALEDKDEREGTLTLLALGLARIGRFDAALEVIKHHHSDKLRQANQDEIWRVTARRLAWQRDIEAATRCANRIKGQFSRADAWLAISVPQSADDQLIDRDEFVETAVKPVQIGIIEEYLNFSEGKFEIPRPRSD